MLLYNSNTPINTELDNRLGVVEPEIKIQITADLELYIDADNGNDGNDGSDLANAFATFARLKTEPVVESSLNEPPLPPMILSLISIASYLLTVLGAM